MARHDTVIRFEGRLMMPQMRAAVHQDSTFLQPVQHKMALRTQGVAPLVEPRLWGWGVRGNNRYYAVQSGQASKSFISSI